MASGSGCGRLETGPLSIQLAPRKGYASAGQPLAVLTNYFAVKFQPRVLYHYNLEVTPEVPTGIQRAVFEELCKVTDVFPDGITPVYDGQKSVYTARILKENQIESEVSLGDLDPCGNKRRNKKFHVVLKLVAQPDLTLLQRFLAGQTSELPQDCIQALDVVLKEAATRKGFLAGKRSFFSKNFGVVSLGSGVEAWKGFYQSIRPGNSDLLLNIDLSALAVLEEIPLLEFLQHTCRTDVRELHRAVQRQDAEGDRFRVQIKKSLKGIRVETIHSAKRRYKIQSVTDEPLNSLTFDMEGSDVRVTEYFERTYKKRLEFDGFPAISAGTKDRKRYIPFEVCKVVGGQRFLKKLSEQQTDKFKNFTMSAPQDRFDSCRTMAKNLHLASQPYEQEFGLDMTPLGKIQARILPKPKVCYSNSEAMINHAGSWNLRNTVLIEGSKISNWTLINFEPRLDTKIVENILVTLPRDAKKYGVIMNPEPATPWITEKGRDVGVAVRHVWEDCRKRTSKDLELLMAIMPFQGDKEIYRSVKKFCEIDYGFLSQCCKAAVIKNPKPNFLGPYLANVILKINAKCGGLNSLLMNEKMKRLPRISAVPTVVIGADVSHPRVGDDSSPSIGAVVGSVDWPYFAKYVTKVRAQSHRTEVLEDLYWEKVDEHGRKQSGGILRDLLSVFRERVSKKPEQIVYFRDGVSEGQFDIVLREECEAIRKACIALGWGSEAPAGEPARKKHKIDETPKITFVVVQKRHHTRLFPFESRDPKANVPPGTVVDRVICHPSHFDFYLCSHAGLQGTSRPAHYHVLLDEIGFSSDEIQSLVNELCYQYARCTKVVSIVPALYYAHLAAKRARDWIDYQGSSDGGSRHETGSVVSEGGGSRRSGGVRPLPQIHDRIHKSMYYI
eukprot:TRINITY_DN1150_c0_g1_i1.p1 TRINITY_DN1150_c0_g1~~TRINITY_DN1150_c0_g1_i1.p1  ORF type:complete len:895 (+),score=130.97 TRINITY_DN1150_c0_g1_i1:157-2841(+)